MTKKKSIGLVILVSSCIIACLYSDILFDLNNSLFSMKGDGLKNYFNYLYHIKHDSSYFTFQGMNYPYNETIFMVDAHPLFSNILKFTSQNIVDLSSYSVGILNFVILASLVVCSIFVFLILDHYKFPWYLAILGAISVTFLSSNTILLKYGHYALSYSCFFPMAWFLILKFQSSNKKIKYSLFILMNTLFWFYTHNYLGFIVLSFTFLFHIFTFILERKKTDFKSFLAIILQVIIPAVFVYSVIRICDTHIGRVDMPYTTEHRATIYSVFFPNHSYLRPVFEVLFNLSPQENQSWCSVGNYIGFSTNLIIVGVILFVLFKLIVYKEWILKTLLSKSEIVMLLSAISLLLFSMSIPFRYGLEFLLPPLIKQFIALGRFAWPFYFVIIILSFNVIRKLFKKNLALVIILISISMLFSEGLSYHLELRKEISKYPNIFHENSKMSLIEPELKAINFSDYQAIVPIPFYYKYISLNSYKSTLRSEELSMRLSYSTGLPLMSAILSRPSVIESKKILQLFISPNYNKPILKDLNEKPILLINTKGEHTHLENKLLKKSQKIFNNKNFELYHLPIDSIFITTKNELEDFIENKDSYKIDENSGYYLKNEFSIYYNSFDELKCDIKYRGEGALALEKKKFNIIYKSNPNQFDNDLEYNLSLWYYNYLYDQSFNTIWIEIKDSSDKIIDSKYIDPVKSNIYDGNWAYNEITFILDHKSDYIVLCSKGENLYSDSIYIDELLISPNNKDIYKPINSENQSDKIIIKNNESLPLPRKKRD